MSGGRLPGGSEVLDYRSQKQPDAGGHNQTDETVEVGEQRSLLIQNRVELALRTIRRFDGRIAGMHEN